MSTVLLARNLCKTFRQRGGRIQALQNVSLTIRAGEIVGLLGANGAGKTTLLKVLSLLIWPDEGEIWLQGHRLKQHANPFPHIGLMVDDPRSFFWRLSGRENLRFFASLYGLARHQQADRVDEVLQATALTAWADQPVQSYSHGMLKRLSLARAMLHRPSLLLLDEPMAGLDPDARAALHQLLRRLSAQGTAILLTTHQREEADALCHRMARLEQGVLVGWEPSAASTSHLAVRKSRPPSIPAAHRSQSEYPAPEETPRPQDHAGAADRWRPSRHLLDVAWAFLWRDFHIERSYRLAFGLQILNIAFSVGVFFFIARLIPPGNIPALQPYGNDYFAFAVIGMAFSGYFGTGLSSFATAIRQAQTTGTLEAMLASPTPAPWIVACAALWSYLMTTLQMLAYLLIGSWMGHTTLVQGNPALALLVLLLSALTFSSLGLLAAAFILVLKRGNVVTWVLQALFTLLGGVYYPTRLLPSWLRALAALLPVTYALEALRQVLLNHAGWRAIRGQVTALALFSLLLLPLALGALQYATHRARRDGSLSHY